ncbi:J domain-containing protein [Puia dinghuensis]|uniref:J domain-containing protein n=1 Tax=Puia dinghuensis TaxID=1792502 RepID=A0A8J2XS66_9BACT|nr:J domain-containing protein [Puia dinghuensis]GGA92530.1 hypothetical protein GCM10011511_14880 [Puia dinghuensis]
MANRFLTGYKTYNTKDGYGNPSEWKKAFQQRMSVDEAKGILSSGEKTPHEILGVSKDATTKQIKTAYHNLLHIWHPDKNPDRLEEATTMTRKIVAAYTLLTE